MEKGGGCCTARRTPPVVCFMLGLKPLVIFIFLAVRPEVVLYAF